MKDTNLPAFLVSCNCDGDNMEEVCPKCKYQEECEEYFLPLKNLIENELKKV